MKSDTIKSLRDSFNLTEVELNIPEYAGLSCFLCKDYIDFLNQYNGGVGNIGENSYLHLWKFEDIEERNKEYGSAEFLTDIILIGSDGGDTAYGINGEGKYIEVPFIGMDDDAVHVIADEFDRFIEYLNKKQ
ncbi:SMI1/KNR4 family protein [Sinanaerobacter sp. ZZT-01]|uniref:SMI1/KNR4 family protein n=1 Tax=Sinanaerobacter sp. ZZT-01 TaxID=3111540 RepID=UPI002D764A1E|nr:SMI1/KNR4 family protein [Sinanaerobacter sp. ZZT-01]WRR92362.1 SMI1/KNR4 family protein [Sinanaerobacter sp. ZZT-01]